MSFPTFIMLVGLPGSGKSTLAEKYKALNYRIHSSDSIREELSGDVNNQRINEKVFALLHKRVKEDLINGLNCIYDATNISYKKRMAFLNELKNIKCWKMAIVVATPYEICRDQNNSRERSIPEHVLKRMYCNFDPPYYYEGWDEINIHYNYPVYRDMYGSAIQFINNTYHFDQQNKYHTETLGKHCELCADYINGHFDGTEGRFVNLYASALLHDNGKPFCKTFKDAKGNDSDNAHYYNHEHVGSYRVLFYNIPLVDKLYVSILIRWHMQMHFIDEQPHTETKYKKLFGDRLWQDLCYLHAGDKEAHCNESSK